MRHKTANGSPTFQISNREAADYITARASYDYPKAYVEVTNRGTHDIQLSPTVFGRFVIPTPGQITDIWLDQYHYHLLRAQSPDDRLLGLVSVVYWGYFTFGDAYARNKINWLINGNRTMPATTPALAVAHITAAINHLNQRCMGEAMASLRGLSQLSQTPFASKVIAFMAPSLAGVYDNRIADGLSLEPWSKNISNGIGQTNSPQVRNCYQSWCIYLSQIASQLNLGISLGYKWEWSCGNDNAQLWRALDVERALFTIFGSTSNDGAA